MGTPEFSKEVLEGLIQNYFGKDYFNPDNRLCVQIPEDCNKHNALVTKLINYFPTILETRENSFERMYAKYGYSGFDYSASRSSKANARNSVSFGSSDRPGSI